MKYKLITIAAAFALLTQCFLVADESPGNRDLVIVKNVSRVSDIDHNHYYFEVTLSNGHTFKANATIDELLSEKIYKEMPFYLVKEEYLPDTPGYSQFFYRSLDETVEIKNSFDSILCDWLPSPSHTIIELVNIKVTDMGHGYRIATLTFSNGHTWQINAMFLSNSFLHVGDKYFLIDWTTQPTIMVNVSDGRVLNVLTHTYTKFVKITW